MATSNLFSVYVKSQDSAYCKENANNTIEVPFNSEYSLVFTNGNSRRAVVKFSIDGINVSGNGYIIPAKDSIEIKRHYNKNESFKFVDLNSVDALVNGKAGPNPDKVKGLIEANFYLEKDYKPTVNTVADCGWTTHPRAYTYNTRSESIISRCSCLNMSNTRDLSDGCTVGGSRTNQSFQSSYIEMEPNSTTIKLFLQGFKVENKIEIGSICRCSKSGMIVIISSIQKDTYYGNIYYGISIDNNCNYCVFNPILLAKNLQEYIDLKIKDRIYSPF